jgi:Na+/H+ antiporter NhaD/arsenite permease-like protein
VLAALLFAAAAAPARASEGVARLIEPSPWAILPFVALLLAIALMPFIHREWWERRYPAVAAALALVTVVYYVAVLGNPVRMLQSGIEYVSFLCLVGSLFVVAGGLLITLSGFATPLKNTLMLLIGAVISNFVGTTGASMVMIRPFMRNNRSRLRAYHIIFFIFVVSNVGGALTPIGDPPLFLGFLRGVPFFWVFENVWHIWLATLAILLAVFAVVDTLAYRRIPAEQRAAEHAAGDATSVAGLHNLGFLAVILGAVFVQNPPFLREAIMIAAAVGSYLTTKKDVHQANDFSFAPIREVAILFLGIFATMVPALDWLELNAANLGVTTAGQFYWGAGVLSSFLDNAPTYLNFLSAAIGVHVPQQAVAQLQALIAAATPDLSTVSPAVQQAYAALQRYHGELIASGSVPLADIQVMYLLGVKPQFIIAISIGAVFFGANTYIGNAPNFMVKSIAEQQGVKMPTFLGYMGRYSIPILIPIFTLVWLLFFRS